MKKVFLFIFAFLVGALILVGYGILKKSPGKPISNIIESAAKPGFSIHDAPTEAIKGNIINSTGDVNWESRTATQASAIASPYPPIQQGEEIDTLENGQVNVEFPNAAMINIAPKTQIDFVQTLPINFVISIASGSADIKKTSNTPVSVRAFHLLTNIEAGEITIGVDQDKGDVDIKILSGSITAAYNDTNLNSHEVNFSAPNEVIFNDLTRGFNP